MLLLLVLLRNAAIHIFSGVLILQNICSSSYLKWTALTMKQFICIIVQIQSISVALLYWLHASCTHHIAEINNQNHRGYTRLGHKWSIPREETTAHLTEELLPAQHATAVEVDHYENVRWHCSLQLSLVIMKSSWQCQQSSAFLASQQYILTKCTANTPLPSPSCTLMYEGYI